MGAMAKGVLRGRVEGSGNAAESEEAAGAGAGCGGAGERKGEDGGLC